MKKALFTLTVLMSSAISFAQNETATKKLAIEKVKAPTPISDVLSVAQTESKPMRSYDNGNYFTVPAGALYYGYDENDMGYGVTMVNVTGLAEGIFKNMNADPFSTTWTWGGYDAASYGLVTPENDFKWVGVPVNMADGINYYDAPTLVGPEDSYHIYNAGGLSGIISIDRISPLTFHDPNIGQEIYGVSRFIDTGYLFGSGNATVTTQIVDNDSIKATYPVTGFTQHFPKPMTPLYVENLFIPAISANGNINPLSDKTLTMTITGDSGKEIAKMTATQADLYNKGNVQYLDPFGVPTLWSLIFKKKKVDPVFGEMDDPFVIDEGFTITVTGFDQEGVDLGLFGYKKKNFSTSPLEVEGATIIMKKEDGTTAETTYQYEYGDRNYSVPVKFNSLTDNVYVQTDLTYTDPSTYESQTFENCNVMRISEDGGSSFLENGAALSLYVSTATPWEDGGYTIEIESTNDDSDWLDTNPTCDPSDWEDSGYGINLLNFYATPVEEGQGRWAVLKVLGRGVESQVRIIILQGTATQDDVTSGIENVVNNTVKANPNAPVYNISGQRVSKESKGILIQNGKKFINK